MRYLIIICILVLTSCQIRFVPSSYYTSAPIITPPVYTYTPTTYTYLSPRTYWWNPRPTYLGNVYHTQHYNHHTPQHHNPRPQTNLPLHTGPIGGRRK